MRKKRESSWKRKFEEKKINKNYKENDGNRIRKKKISI